MKFDQKDCAPETKMDNWNSIDWKQVKQEVKSLQAIITTASNEIKGIDKYTLYEIEKSNIVSKKRISNAG